jgi:hypothetical protein
MYSALVAQAQRIDVGADRVVLTFAPSQKIGPTFEKFKPALDGIATRLAGRKVVVVSDTSGKEPASSDPAAPPPVDPAKKSALKEQAMADPGVQALFEVFPGDIRDVEEM